MPPAFAEPLRAAWLRLRTVFRRRQLQSDLEDEMAFHLAMRERKERAAGVSPRDAQAAARRQFGHVASVMENCRELWTFVWLETWWQDLRYAVRQLRRSPGFTAVAAVTLGLGIGATTAIYSMLDATLWMPMVLPPHAERLVAVVQAVPGQPHFWSAAAPADIDDVRQNSAAIDSLASWRLTMVNVVDSGGEALRLDATLVTANLFDVLGVAPALGRTFRAGEDQPGSEREVVLGDSLWRRRFGGDPTLVGRSIRLDDQNYTVIGIMPPNFYFPRPTRELWVPLALTPEERNSRSVLLLDSVGRLKPGRTPAQFAAELAGMASRLEREHPDTNTKRRFLAWTWQRYITGELVPIYSAMLLGSAFFVLLIACVNVANLQFARAMGRWREVAVRTALGAGRQRLLRQLLTESMVLAAAGGALGLLLAKWGLHFIRAGVPAELERYMPGLKDLGLNRSGLEFTLIATLLSGILAGLLPAWRSSRPNLVESLKEGGLSFGGGPGRNRLRAVLMGGEVALAVVLLAGAGLMVRGFQSLVGGSTNLRPASMLTLHLSLTENKYREDHQVAAFYREVLRRVAALPGVRSAVAVTALPHSRHFSRLPVIVEGRPAEPGEPTRALVQSVSPEYFAAMFIPLREGRLPGAADGAGRPRVAAVSERMAQRWWPAGVSPIGSRVQVGDEGPRPWVTIVGVVGDIEHSMVDRDLIPAVYLPITQSPEREMDIGIRTAAESVAAGSLAPAVRDAIRALDPEQPIANLNTLSTLIQQEAFVFVYMAAMMGTFGLLALALSAVGVYGVTASVISARTHEIGIRIALGAPRGKVLGMLFRSGMTTACVGLAVGLIPAYGLARLMRATVFGVSAVGPGVFLGIPLALAGAAALAIYIPARRAVKADPMAALRNE